MGLFKANENYNPICNAYLSTVFASCTAMDRVIRLFVYADYLMTDPMGNMPRQNRTEKLFPAL